MIRKRKAVRRSILYPPDRSFPVTVLHSMCGGEQIQLQLKYFELSAENDAAFFLSILTRIPLVLLKGNTEEE